MTQEMLLQQLRQTTDPAAAVAAALELLDQTRRRELVDAALRVLQNNELDSRARPVLRSKTLYYFENNRHDAGAFIRETLLRMLTEIGHPDEHDLYLRGLNTYEIQLLMGEVTQNLRAVSLIGLAINEPELAYLHATRLLSELDSTSKFNGEPAVTAINLLAQQKQILPIYQFLLLAGIDALDSGQNEVVGKALESMGEGFPVDLYRQLVELFADLDRAVVNMGMMTHIVEQRVRDLYPALDAMMTQTRHDELHNYGVVMLAVSRDDDLIARLFALAKLSPQRRVANFIEALELIPGAEKDDLLATLRARQEN